MNRVLVIVAAGVATLLATPAVAAQEQPAPPAPVPTDNGSITMELIDQSFDLTPNGTIELSYRLRGDLDTVAEIAPPTTTTTTTTGTTPPPADVEAGGDVDAEAAPPPVELIARVINYEAITDPAELIGLVGPEPRLDRLPPFIDGTDIIDIRSMISVVSPDEAILDLSVPTDTDVSVSERLEFNNDGIHPIVVQLRADDQVVARHGTVVERRSGNPATPPSIDLALFGATDDPGINATMAQYSEAGGVFRELVAAAAEADTGITLAIPPSVVSGAVASGAVDPDDPVLRGAVLLAGPATPFDVSSAVAIGRVDAFVRQLRVGEDEIADAIGQTPTRDIWSTTTELSGPAAQALRDLGVRYLAMPPDIYRTTIVGDPDAEIPADDRFIQLPLPDGGTIPLLVLDEDLGRQITVEATTEILAARTSAEWSIETIADLRLEQYAAPPEERQDRRSHLIATPDLGPFDPTLIGELARISATTEAIRFMPATAFTSATASVQTDTTPRLPSVAGPSLEFRLLRIAEVSDQLEDVASMLPAGDPRPVEWAQLLDSFVSTAVDDETVNAELDQVLADAETIRNGVVAPDPFTFTLTGREGAINVRVGNELAEPVDVVVRLTSPRLDFPEGDMRVTLAPNDVTVVNVPVVARSNGTSPVRVEILTPSLDPLTRPVTLTSRFTSLTGLGQVLTGGLLLVLLTWWFSHWRARRRAANRLADTEPDTQPHTEPDVPPDIEPASSVDAGGTAAPAE